MSPHPDVYVTTEMAAELAGVSPATIRSWVARRLLTPRFKVGRRSYFTEQDVYEAEHAARTRDVTGRSTKRLA